MLDLSQQFQVYKNNVKYQQYCFFNVQVSYLQSEESVQLLQSLTFHDINYQMHSQLHEENHQLKHLVVLITQLEINNSN